MLSGTISRTANRWFLSVTVEVPDPPVLLRENQAVGVDLGVSALATVSTGEKVAGPKAYEARRTHGLRPIVPDPDPQAHLHLRHGIFPWARQDFTFQGRPVSCMPVIRTRVQPPLPRGSHWGHPGGGGRPGFDDNREFPRFRRCLALDTACRQSCLDAAL